MVLPPPVFSFFLASPSARLKRQNSVPRGGCVFLLVIRRMRTRKVSGELSWTKNRTQVTLLDFDDIF